MCCSNIDAKAETELRLPSHLRQSGTYRSATVNRVRQNARMREVKLPFESSTAAICIQIPSRLPTYHLQKDTSHGRHPVDRTQNRGPMRGFHELAWLTVAGGFTFGMLLSLMAGS